MGAFPAPEPEPEPLSAPVPLPVWENILFRSQLFDRTLAPAPPLPAPPGEEESISICLHSWVYTVEASDPGSPADSRPARTRRKTEDACTHGLVPFFAIEAQRAALPLLPACAALDPDQHRNEASMLAACAMLHDDRMAAAEVMNRADALRHAHGLSDLDEVADLFDYRGSVDWNGERNATGSLAQARFWLTKMAEGRPTNFYPERLEGESPYRVRLSGRLVRTIELDRNSEPVREEARVEQIWTFGPSREFQIERATVGAFEPMPEPR